MNAICEKSSKSRLTHGASALAIMAALGLTAAAAAPAVAAPVDTLRIFDVNQTAAVGNDPVQFDFDGDGFDDYRVTVEAVEVPDALFVGGFVSEVATIEGLSNEGNLDALVLEDDGFAQVFGSGEEVSGLTEANRAGSAILYQDFFDDLASAGPFGEPGSTGFVGLAFFDTDESLHFGWIEMTRGSIVVGQGGFQTVANLAAPTPGAGVVPLPPAIALLGTAVLGLGAAGMRRRKRRA